MAWASRTLLCVALIFAVAACGRRDPGDVTPATLSLVGFAVVSEAPAGASQIDSVVRVECANAGTGVLGVTALVLSRDPALLIVDGSVRFGAIAAGAKVPSLDTLTIRRDVTTPFDATGLSFVALSWGDDTRVGGGTSAQGDVLRSHFVDLTNASATDVSVAARVLSSVPEVVVTDALIDAPRVPAGLRFSTRDLFAFRHAAEHVFSPDVLPFALQLGIARSGDMDGDGDVDAQDVNLAVRCRHRDPHTDCRCANADMDADGDIDTGDLDALTRARGPRDLPLATPDVTTPVVLVAAPAGGASVAASPAQITGIVLEPAFRVTVNGVAATLNPVHPYDWSALVPLAPGANDVLVEATDLACNVGQARVALNLATSDQTAPRVTLGAPSAVQAGGLLRAVAEAADDGGLAGLELFVDGVRVASGASSPLSVDAVAPDLAGATVTLRALARDTAGNEAEARATVAVRADVDTTPPRVDTLLLPPSAAPGTRFRVRADASDDRGVAEVRFTRAGGPTLVDAIPPFEAELDVPANAVPGASVAVAVEAVDGADQRGSASGNVLVAAQPDLASPTGVVIQAPAEATPAARVPLSATASDDVGVAVVRFLADGAVVGEDASAPYELTALVPAALAAGAQVTWTARAIDFAGNAADAPPVATRIVAPGTGFVAGEVYDHSTGRPLAGATVSVLEVAGAAPAPAIATSTDARGRYRVVLEQGPARLRIAHTGYTGAWRDAQVLRGGITLPLDTRLLPVAAAVAITQRDGGSVALPDGSAQVEIAPGALAGDATLALSALSPQTLPAPLPLGWSPAAALDVAVQGAGFAAPVAVELTDPAAGASASGAPIAVAYELAARQWRRVASQPGAPTGRVRVLLSAPTAVALVRADVAPETPPLPAEGSTLLGVSPRGLPASATLDLTPSPRIVFAGPGARADVTATLQGTLPSGTRIEVALRETYERIDGGRLDPEGFTQDFLLFASNDGPHAGFVVTPEPALDALLLREGVVTLDAEPPAPDRVTGILSPTGGRLVTPGGVALDVLPGALGAATAVTLGSFDPATLGLPNDPRFDLIAGALLDLGGAALASAGVLTLPAPAGVAASDVILLVRIVSFGASSELELVGLAQPVAGGLSVGAGGGGLPFPGLRGEGRFVLARLRVPIGFVTGTLAGAGGETILRASSLPFVARASGTGGYAVAATLGSVDLAAQDRTSGNAANATLNLAAAGAVATRDLSLAPTSVQVASIDPPDAARDVAVATAISVRFTSLVDAATANASSVVLTAGGSAIPGAIGLAPDGLTLTFRPDAPLAGATAHAVRLAGLLDRFGRPLAGSGAGGAFTSAFTTVDTTPPARPPAGAVTLSTPTDGRSEARGTQGSALPGGAVVISNETRGIDTIVTVAADGSFLAVFRAEPDDVIALLLISPAGERVRLDPIPFSDGAGGFRLGPLGGAASTPGGITASVLPGALVRGTTVSVRDVDAAAFAPDLPAGFAPVAALRLDVPDGSFVDVDELIVSEATDRVPPAGAVHAPLRVRERRIGPVGIDAASRLDFRASARLVDGSARALSLVVPGAAAPCTDTAELRSDARAPRLRIAASRCAAAGQLFAVEADAVQPRFDLSAPPPAGAGATDGFLWLRRAPGAGAPRWIVEEVAALAGGPVGPSLDTTSGSPFGIRASGDYVLVRAAAALAFAEGSVLGGDAFVEVDGAFFVAATRGSVGGFLLPIAAGVPATLRVLETDLATERTTRGLGPIAGGTTEAVGDLGPASLPPLTVALDQAADGVLVGRRELRFLFGEAVDPATVVGTGVFVVDDRGRTVAGTRLVQGDGRTVVFRPARPWRLGAGYVAHVTPAVSGRSGARLAAEAAFPVTAFAPAVITTLPGTRVADAVALGLRAYFLDDARLRNVDLSVPTAPIEGAARDLALRGTRLAFAPQPGAVQLVASAGELDDYGALLRFALGAPAAPAALGRRELSTPFGAPSRAGVDPGVGVPASLAVLGANVTVATRGLGLQGLAVDAIGGALGPSTVRFPVVPQTFDDVASAEGRLVSVSIQGITLHDPATLAPIASAPLGAAPFDLELVRVGPRLLALVATGLDGGLQVFDLAASGPPVRVARIGLPCSTQRAVADGALARAFVACGGVRLFPLDLADVDGLDPVDADRDGLDDRLAGELSLPLPLESLALAEPHALGLLAAAERGLVVLQLGPAEAVISDVRRDPVSADLGDAQSIVAGGEAFHSDAALLVGIEARIPPGHPGLIARIEGAAALAFDDGARERPLAPGRNALALRPGSRAETATQDFAVAVREAGPSTDALARFAGTLAPVPLVELVTVSGPPGGLDLGTASSGVVELVGRTADGRTFDVSPYATLAPEIPQIGRASTGGRFDAVAGGTTTLGFRVGSFTGSTEVRSALAPVPVSLVVAPLELRIEALAASSALQVEAVLSDGSRRVVAAADGIAFASADPAVATVDPAGRVVAIAEGSTEIRVAAAGTIARTIPVTVAVRRTANLARLELASGSAEISSDEPLLSVNAYALGSGSRDGLTVRFRLTAAGATDRSAQDETDDDGIAQASFEVPLGSGSVTVEAEVVDPTDGDTLRASRTFAVVERNRDGEPNDTLAQAVTLVPGRTVNGGVGAPGDAADVFRVRLGVSGALALRLDSGNGSDVDLELLDAAGLVVERATAGTLVATISRPAGGDAVFARVASRGAATPYAISARFDPERPAITAIDPPSAPGGARVTIRGVGFALAPEENVVSFAGLLTEVKSASAGAIEVVVPGFASDGPVRVAVRGQESDDFGFMTGVAAHWSQHLRSELPDGADFVRDPIGGPIVVRERIAVRFAPEVPRATADTLAQGLGGSVVAVWPPTNEYTLRLPGKSLAELYALLVSLRQQPDVRSTRLLHQDEPTGFPRGVEQRFRPRLDERPPNAASRQTHASLVTSAWKQIRAFEAWDAVADSGRFDRTGDFASGGTIRIAVIDTGLDLTPLNTVHFDGGVANARDAYEYDAGTFGTLTPNPHGTHCAALIGASNEPALGRPAVGVLGGVLPEGAAPFYTIDVYRGTMPLVTLGIVTGTSAVDGNEVRYAISGCVAEWGGILGAHVLTLDSCDPAVVAGRGVVPAQIYSLSFGTLLANPAAEPDPALAAQQQAVIDGQIDYYRQLFKRQPTALFVTGAGNDGTSADTFFPSAMTRDPEVGSRVISVAAISQGWPEMDSRDRGADQLAGFSNTGEKVDIGAPGLAVLSVPTTRTDAGQSIFGVSAGTDHDFFNGTSAATPIVAGAAALAMALDASLNAAGVKQLVIDTATPLKGQGPDLQFGPGGSNRRLDLLSFVQRIFALRGASIAGSAVTVDNTTPFAPGRKRFLWSLDTLRNDIHRIALAPGFESTLATPLTSDLRLKDLEAAGCRHPHAMLPSPTGDELYIACRGTDKILVWNAHTNDPGDYAFSGGARPATIDLLSAFDPDLSTIQMAISPDGRWLAVPSNGRIIDWIDVHQARSVNYIQVPPAATGKLRALAFDPNGDLFGLVAEDPAQVRAGEATGTLFRMKVDPLAPLAAGSSASDFRLRLIYHPLPFPPPVRDEALDPRGGDPVRLAVQGRLLQAERLYVVYGDEASPVAFTAHDPSTLAPVASPIEGEILANVQGRAIPLYGAGGNPFVFGNIPDAALETGVSGARALFVDSVNGLAYAIFRGTGNLGFLRKIPGIGGFREIRSVTNAGGAFEGPRTEVVANLGATIDPSGNLSFGVVGTFELRDKRIYTPGPFPIGQAMDQEAALLAVHLSAGVGSSLLRLYSTAKITTADNAIDSAAAADHALDDDGRVVSTDLALGIGTARDLAFQPQLTVRAPQRGALTRGVLGVNVAIWDPTITAIFCEIVDQTTGTITATSPTHPLSSIEREVGTPNRQAVEILSLSNFAPQGSPVCRFAALPAGRYALRVHGEKGSSEVIEEVPFQHE